MSTTIEIDKTGRIVIPKRLRDALHLVPGTRFKVERSGDRIFFEPEFTEPQLVLKDGMWVMAGGVPITDAETTASIQHGYDERAKRIMEGSGLE
jgi:AbrB family looped-hinge helix DNA binding protein